MDSYRKAEAPKKVSSRRSTGKASEKSTRAAGQRQSQRGLEQQEGRNAVPQKNRKADPQDKQKAGEQESRRAGTQENRKAALQVPKEFLCPVRHKCGGCDYQGMPYEEQISRKTVYLKNLLVKDGLVEKMLPIVQMEDPWHYRCKVHAVFDHDRKGNPISGIYEKNSHKVVPVESCLIEDKEADEIIGSIRKLLPSFKIKTYDEDSGYGLLRHVLIRKGYVTGQMMVVLVTAEPIFPSKNNFVKALLKLHPSITTIVQNINEKSTSMVLGERNVTLYGKGYIEDQISGRTFRISPNSFYQVNPRQTQILYDKAMEAAGLTGSETVVDAYCGTGTIGIIAAEKAKQVIGVELNRNAVKDALINARANNVSNIDFVNADAGDFLQEAAAEGAKIDVVIMDPPRTGSTEAFLDAVAAIQPKRVVYVSCGPDTLARDLRYLKKKGYRAVSAQGVDLFPHTKDVECVALLVRQFETAKTFVNVSLDMDEYRELKNKNKD